MLAPKHLFQLFVKAGKTWSDDYAPSMGAAISYYTVFSIAPLLVIVIAVAGAFFGREAVQGLIAAQLAGLIGQQGADLVQGLVAAASDTDKGLVAGLISGFVLLVGATTVFAELQSALDRIWHIPPSEKPQGIWAILRARLLSFGLILGLVFLLMVSLAVGAAVAAIGTLTAQLMPGSEALLQLLNLAVSLGIITLLFAMIFKLMPSTPIAWRDVWVGAFTTAVLFEVGKFLIGLYIGKSSMTESFAAAGSLVVLLAWVYYAAQIFLLGAEFTKVYADDHGSRATSHATHGTAATAAVGITTAGSARSTDLPLSAAPKLTETPWSVAHNPRRRDPALETPVYRAAEVGLRTALARLATEVAALALVTIAKKLVHKRRRRLQSRLL
jgi:membrane protein